MKSPDTPVTAGICSCLEWWFWKLAVGATTVPWTIRCNLVMRVGKWSPVLAAARPGKGGGRRGDAMKCSGENLINTLKDWQHTGCSTLLVMMPHKEMHDPMAVIEELGMLAAIVLNSRRFKNITLLFTQLHVMGHMRGVNITSLQVPLNENFGLGGRPPDHFITFPEQIAIIAECERGQFASSSVW